MSNTKVYERWVAMIERCESINTINYKKYGGRGIKVCKKWRNSFVKFYEDMGPMPTNKHEIDRIDNDGNYEPRNCRWATPKENCRNKSNNHTLTFRGKTMTIQEWSEKIGINNSTLLKRVTEYKWSTEKALTTPVKIYKKRK